MHFVEIVFNIDSNQFENAQTLSGKAYEDFRQVSALSEFFWERWVVCFCMHFSDFH